jgi:diguanylate cyclase (GGDEF)-like protein
MISLPASLRQSGPFLRQLLISYWLGSTLVIGGALTLYDLWEHQKQTVREGEQITQLVAASMRTQLTIKQRQQLLEAYAQTNRTERFDRVNVTLVLDRNGRIAYSSRPTWRSLLIRDPLFDQMAQDDPDFRAVVECFRRRDTTCMELRSEDWSLHLGGISIVRPVWMPPTDLGLPRQPFLVMVNFDAGMLIADVLQDFPWLVLMSSLIAAMLAGGLWYLLAARMLPQLVEASQTDALTQLINRTSFMDLAMEMLAEAEERQGDLVFAILDIDHFKRINDTYGHGCGDAALASVGTLLLNVTRPEDLVCRFGGEEFAMLIEAPREAGAKALERLRLQLEMNSLLHNGNRIPLTVSIGAAATAQCGYNVDFLYNAADKALYTAKRRGRNRLEWNEGELVSRLSLSPEMSR